MLPLSGSASQRNTRFSLSENISLSIVLFLIGSLFFGFGGLLGIKVPFLIEVPFVMLLFFYQFRLWDRQSIIILLSLFVLAFVHFSVFGFYYNAVELALTKWLQFVVCTVAAISLCVAICLVPRNRQHKIWAILLFITFCSVIFERYLRFASDLFLKYRLSVFDNEFVYQNATRDLGLYGQIRPTFITPEPSILGIFISLITIGYFASSKAKKRQFFLSLGSLIIMLYSVRSPTLIAGFMGLVVFGFLRVAGESWAKGLAGVAAVWTVVLSLASTELLIEAFSRAASQGASLIGRVLLPLYVLFSSFRILIIGIGPLPELHFGFDDFLLNGEVFSSLLDANARASNWDHATTNALLELLIILGIPGGVVLLLHVKSIIYRIVGYSGIGFAVVLLFAGTMGGALSLRTWVVCGCVAGFTVLSLKRTSRRF